MKAWLAGTSSPVLGTSSGPTVRSVSSAFSGTKTVPPLLTVWSTPWSKNWPKKVNIELYGGDKPTSVVTFSMKRDLWEGTQAGGSATTTGVTLGADGSVVQGIELGPLPCVRTGWPAAASAAGLSLVWSTMRLEIVRGWVSNTMLSASFCL